MAYYLNPAHRGYLLTEAGQHRLAEGGIAGAYLDPEGYVAIPGKRTTLYSQPAPTREEAYKEVCACVCMCACVRMCLYVYVFQVRTAQLAYAFNLSLNMQT